jgi:SAM-dependent methyltransferase
VSVKDHFSRQAGDYQQFRPRYPPQLAAHLAQIAPGTALALDVATGNGQAAVDLAAHFARVLASEPSASQLKHRVPHPRVQYLRHAAERIAVRDRAAELLTVAQAAHWLDLRRFYAEARRVLRPGGIVALWTYALFRVDPATDAAIDEFYRDRVGRFWPPERHYVEAEYRTLPFPLEELPAPRFAIDARFSLEALLNYVGTWSAVDRCRQQSGVDPLPELAARLKPQWSPGEVRPVDWPIHLRIGRV